MERSNSYAVARQALDAPSGIAFPQSFQQAGSSYAAFHYPLGPIAGFRHGKGLLIQYRIEYDNVCEDGEEHDGEQPTHFVPYCGEAHYCAYDEAVQLEEVQARTVQLIEQNDPELELSDFPIVLQKVIP